MLNIFFGKENVPNGYRRVLDIHNHFNCIAPSDMKESDLGSQFLYCVLQDDIKSVYLSPQLSDDYLHTLLTLAINKDIHIILVHYLAIPASYIEHYGLVINGILIGSGITYVQSYLSWSCSQRKDRG